MLASDYPYVVHLHSDERLGRGTALNRAFKSSRGDILAYIDVDLATDMLHLSELIDQIRSGYDLATGSRMMPESDAVRSAKRGIASKGFNFLVRMMLGSKLYDHQCGFKAFKRSALLDLLDQVDSGPGTASRLCGGRVPDQVATREFYQGRYEEGCGWDGLGDYQVAAGVWI
jgi:glycosyltransferase involved in cell wall biosynthesis